MSWFVCVVNLRIFTLFKFDNLRQVSSLACPLSSTHLPGATQNVNFLLCRMEPFYYRFIDKFFLFGMYFHTFIVRNLSCLVGLPALLSGSGLGFLLFFGGQNRLLGKISFSFSLRHETVVTGCRESENSELSPPPNAINGFIRVNFTNRASPTRYPVPLEHL